MSANAYEYEELKDVIEAIVSLNNIKTLDELLKYLDDNKDKCYCNF